MKTCAKLAHAWWLPHFESRRLAHVCDRAHFESSGRAVLAVSLLLIAQFGLLSFSGFIPTANFGLMTAVGLFSGQLFELLLLPALLLLKDGRKAPLKVPRHVTH